MESEEEDIDGTSRSEGEMEVEVMDPPPEGAPPGFRERLAMALRSTQADVLTAAEAGFRGVYKSAEEYVEQQLAEHLPAFLSWLLACCDRSKLLDGYENGQLVVWTVALDDGRVLVFEHARAAGPPGAGALYFEVPRDNTRVLAVPWGLPR